MFSSDTEAHTHCPLLETAEAENRYAIEGLPNIPFLL